VKLPDEAHLPPVLRHIPPRNAKARAFSGQIALQEANPVSEIEGRLRSHNSITGAAIDNLDVNVGHFIHWCLRSITGVTYYEHCAHEP